MTDLRANASPSAAKPYAWRTLTPFLPIVAIVAFVFLYYRPFLEPGLPAGNFGSYVMGTVFEDRLIPTPLSLPTWNPYQMCGRPEQGFMSPFKLLALPLVGLDPIAKLKFLVLIYLALAGLAMYHLLRRSGAGVHAALFGGLAYPAMPHAIFHTTVSGDIHVAMFYALLPLIAAAVFALKPPYVRPVAALGLVLGLAFVRDTQRTALTAVLVGLVLALAIAATAAAALVDRDPRAGERTRCRAAVLAAFLAAFGLAVAIDAFELVNATLGDPYQGGYLPDQQEAGLRKWSLDNLYSFFDRDASFARALDGVSSGLIHASTSRYLGLSLGGLVLIGALAPSGLGPRRRRFWFALALVVVSVWLSFGVRSPFAAGWPRWQRILSHAEVPLAYKLAPGLALLAVLVAGTAVLERNLAFLRGRHGRAAVCCLGMVALFLTTRPFVAVRVVVWFIRPLRNPDWFQASVAPFAVVYAASLVVAAIAERLRPSRAAIATLAMFAVVLADLSPYRQSLERSKTSAGDLASLQHAFAAITADRDSFRVLSSERVVNLADLASIWHGHALAWDHRSYSAPRRTLAYIARIHLLFEHEQRPLEAARLAGLANVKYLVDAPHPEEAAARVPLLVAASASPELVTYRNLAWRPFVQTYGNARTLHGAEEEVWSAVLAESENDTVVIDDAEVPEATDSVATPADPRAGTRPPPELAWTRPAPERILVTVASELPLYLVVAESFHPGWSARVDGKPVRLYPANYAFLGVGLPAGRHALEFRFAQPWRYWLWGLVSLVSLTVALLVLPRVALKSTAAENPRTPRRVHRGHRIP